MCQAIRVICAAPGCAFKIILRADEWAIDNKLISGAMRKMMALVGLFFLWFDSGWMA
jgi:hypothetical protein